jgi:flagellar hook-basal body complex protein FliE
MKQIDMSQMLSEMRALAAQAHSTPAKDKPSAVADFAGLLRQSVEAVNEAQQQANALAEGFERGDPQMQLSEVMIALQKSRISFLAMTQVRNKLLEAYQDIKNMPI